MMLVDVVRVLGILVITAYVWWLCSVFIVPLWDALEPFIASFNNDFSETALGTLGLLKTIWGYIPYLVALITFLWLYVRSQKVEPDTYYYPPQ